MLYPVRVRPHNRAGFVSGCNIARIPAVQFGLDSRCALLCCLCLAAVPATAQQPPMVNCDHAAPPLGTHYVCEDPQNPCRCRLERDDPKTPPGDYARNPTVPDRRVWIDPRRKIYYCSEKKPARLPKHYLRLTEQEARRRGYKAAPEARCEQMKEKPK